jgi:hypothetical protein
MTTMTNPFADLSSFAYRSQHAAADALETWAGFAEAANDAAGSQARNLRQILHGMFDLIEQGFRVEREIATYLTIASQVFARAADSARELTDIALASVEAAAQAAGHSR